LCVRLAFLVEVLIATCAGATHGTVAASERHAVIVHAPALSNAAMAWRDYRSAGGWTVTLLPAQPKEACESLRTRIQAVITARTAPDRTAILLLGDVGENGIPTFQFEQGEPSLLRGGEPTFASDHPYALLTEDEPSMVAIGRVPVATDVEALAVLAKIRRYEEDAPAGPWRHRVTYVAGEGHFGIFDTLLEQVFIRFVNESVPPSYDVSVTYAKPDSKWCPPLTCVERTTLERLSEGSLLFNYVGHGHAEGVDTLRWGPKEEERRAPILRGSALKDLPSCSGRHPIALMTCCSTGWFDRSPDHGRDRDSLAELMLEHPEGPVAIVAGTRPTHPYGNAVFQKELTRMLIAHADETMGEIDRRARLAMFDLDARDRELDAMVAPIAKLTKWKLSLEDLRLMHVRMYALIGDPMMRIASPGAKVEGLAIAEGHVTGRVPTIATGTVEVLIETARDDCVSTDVQLAAPNDDAEARAAHNYPLVNDRVLWRGQGDIREGRFSIPLPSPLPGRSAMLRVRATEAPPTVGARAAEAIGGMRLTRRHVESGSRTESPSGS
jgi:hypothetical protein